MNAEVTFNLSPSGGHHLVVRLPDRQYLRQSGPLPPTLASRSPAAERLGVRRKFVEPLTDEGNSVKYGLSVVEGAHSYRPRVPSTLGRRLGEGDGLLRRDIHILRSIIGAEGGLRCPVPGFVGASGVKKPVAAAVRLRFQEV